jgi:carotenoid cleavage dioxygenase
MTPRTAQREQFDPTRVAHLSGLFAPVTDEVDGMIHGVWLSEGRARYRNRFVRTPRRGRGEGGTTQ